MYKRSVELQMLMDGIQAFIARPEPMMSKIKKAHCSFCRPALFVSRNGSWLVICR